MALALQSSDSHLRELDLSNNDMQDSKVKLLSVALKSSNCQVNILRFDFHSSNTVDDITDYIYIFSTNAIIANNQSKDILRQKYTAQLLPRSLPRYASRFESHFYKSHSHSSLTGLNTDLSLLFTNLWISGSQSCS